jgi:hypothetical protein
MNSSFNFISNLLLSNKIKQTLKRDWRTEMEKRLKRWMCRRRSRHWWRCSREYLKWRQRAKKLGLGLGLEWCRVGCWRRRLGKIVAGFVIGFGFRVFRRDSTRTWEWEPVVVMEVRVMVEEEIGGGSDGWGGKSALDFRRDFDEEAREWVWFCCENLMPLGSMCLSFLLLLLYLVSAQTQMS